MLIPRHQARPGLWVKWFVNPFFHQRGKATVICRRTRIDVLPFQPFSPGDYSTIKDLATVNNGVDPVIIGDHVRVEMGNVVIGPVTIGNNVIMAQNIVLSDLNHVYEDVNTPIQFQPVTMAPIVIEDDSCIGTNPVITSSVTIGKHSTVADRALVTKSVPPYSIVGGNPAKLICQYNNETAC